MREVNNLRSLNEYQYASQIFSQGLNLISGTNADPGAMEILVSIAELMNRMKEKSIALTLVTLFADHPMISTGLNSRAIRLREALVFENIQPENRGWSLDQISRIVGDVKLILEQKKPLKS